MTDHKKRNLFFQSKGPFVTTCTTRFNIRKFCLLPTECIDVFCMVVGTNNDYYPIQT